jgi:hypothetical protein
MLGAIIGDMAGSIYEFANTKRTDLPKVVSTMRRHGGGAAAAAMSTHITGSARSVKLNTVMKVCGSTVAH